LTVGHSVDEAAFWFLSLDKTCHAQLLVDAASAGSGHKKIFINDEEAAFTYKQVGTPEKGWLGSYFFLLSTHNNCQNFRSLLSTLVTNFFNKHSKDIMMSSWQRQGAPF
jgi:hypothetical protein